MRTYVTPPRTRIYAIGDLHGYRTALRSMMAKIAEDVRERHIENVIIVLLGDYIDRGPDSAGLIDDLIALQQSEPSPQFIFLKGNHEGGLLGFLEDPEEHSGWLAWGGEDTLASYGIFHDKAIYIEDQAESLSYRFNNIIPPAHRAFFKNLSLHYQSGDYLFVHAGIRPHFPLNQQNEQDLTFIRKGFLDYAGSHPWRVVHGHTITKEPEVLPNRINIDTGLYKHGILSCAVLENDHVNIMQVRL